MNSFIQEHSRAENQMSLAEEFEHYSNLLKTLPEAYSDDDRREIRDFLLLGYKRYSYLNIDDFDWVNPKIKQGFLYIDAIEKAFVTLQKSSKGYLYLDEEGVDYAFHSQMVWERYQACLDEKLEVLPKEVLELLEKIRADIDNGVNEDWYEANIPDLSFMIPKEITAYTDEFNWIYVIQGGLVRMFAKALGIDSQYRVVLDKGSNEIRVVAVRQLNPSRFWGVDFYECYKTNLKSEWWIFDTTDGRRVRIEFGNNSSHDGLLISKFSPNEPPPNVFYGTTSRDQIKWMKLIRFFCQHWVSLQPPFCLGIKTFRASSKATDADMALDYELTCSECGYHIHVSEGYDWRFFFRTKDLLFKALWRDRGNRGNRGNPVWPWYESVHRQIDTFMLYADISPNHHETRDNLIWEVEDTLVRCEKCGRFEVVPKISIHVKAKNLSPEDIDLRGWEPDPTDPDGYFIAYKHHCSHCGGRLSEPKSEELICPHCHGTLVKII